MTCGFRSTRRVARGTRTRSPNAARKSLFVIRLAAVAAVGFTGTYVDANAIAPATTREVGTIVEGGGAHFVDGGIVGQPELADAINGYIGQYQVDWGHLFAGSVIATIPVIILFAFIEGRVVGGLTAGSIK